ncbi:MAG: beta-galactosidase [bacterium]
MPKHYTKKIKTNFKRSLLVKIALILAVIVLVMFGISIWYKTSQASKPLKLGVSFIPSYATSLGLDPKQTMDALLDINIKHFRLTSYWNEGEPKEGHYDFSQLDWQFEKAEKHNAKVMLSLGLRQPRWPECHMPQWATNQPADRWQPQLEDYIKAVVERYQDSPALESYQLENEFMLKNFGECKNFDIQRLKNEYKLVKQTDPDHPIIITRSDNFPMPMTGQPRPDIVGFSVYRRVWDGTITKRYFTYPMPAWYFGYQAGLQKILTGKESQIHELQAEAWPPNGQSMQQTSVAEQNKSLSPNRLKDRFEYGEATGMREIYLWGGEYWYYRKEILKDPTLWNVAKEEYKKDITK